MQYYSVVREEGNPTICDNIDKPGRHDAKRSKADTEGKKTPRYRLQEDSKMTKPIQKQKVEWWLPGAGVRGKWGGISHRVQNSAWVKHE